MLCSLDRSANRIQIRLTPISYKHTPIYLPMFSDIINKNLTVLRHKIKEHYLFSFMNIYSRNLDLCSPHANVLNQFSLLRQYRIPFRCSGSIN